MPRLVITVTDKMDQVLKAESKRTGAPVAAIVRKAIEEWAQRRELEAPDEITWGGARDGSADEDKELGQIEAVAAI